MNQILLREASGLLEKYEDILNRMIDGDSTASEDLRSALEGGDLFAGTEALGQAVSNVNSRELANNYREFSPNDLRTIARTVDSLYSNRAAEALLEAAEKETKKSQTVYDMAVILQALELTRYVMKRHMRSGDGIQLISRAISGLGSDKPDIVDGAIKLAYEASRKY